MGGKWARRLDKESCTAYRLVLCATDEARASSTGTKCNGYDVLGCVEGDGCRLNHRRCVVHLRYDWMSDSP
jgi:hypothetical protein